MSILDLDRRHVWHPFTQGQTAQPPLPIRSAQGATLIAEDGSRYLDLVSSWWVNLHGHAHPAIAAAIARQAGELEQVIFADFTHAPGATLAARLSGLLPGALNRVFYSDNGSTAVEVALKMALQYWSNRGEERRLFVGFAGGYHGDTVGAMSAGRASGFFRAWESMLFPVDIAPYPATWQGDPDVETKEAEALAALDHILAAQQGHTAAVVVEPLIQGAGGMRMVSPRFMQGLAERVKRAGALLILDEVMTGFGRTGDLFACLKCGIEPDLICLSKGIAGGFLPFAATIASDAIHDAFLDRSVEKAFLHGHSFTANPLGCAAALASLDLLQGEACQNAIATLAAIHGERLPRLQDTGRAIRPRQHGTVAAIDVICGDGGYASGIGDELKARFRDKGLLLRPLGNVLYLLPPYCVTAEELHRAYDMIEEVLRALPEGGDDEGPGLP